MPAISGHLPFAISNRTVNPLVRGVLRSPLHPLLSRRLLLITYTGTRSGSPHTIPVGYSERDGVILIEVGLPERKRWWRNLRRPAAVTLRLRGREVDGVAAAIERPDGSVGVEVKGTSSAT